VADFAVRYNNFSGGDWGITADDKAWNYRRGHVLYNEFSATNMAVYPSGLLGVRAGWKRLDTTGKAVGLPSTYTGAIRGFDVVGNKLILATVDKTYDVYWDLNLAPGGALPANAPISLPGGLSPTDAAQFLRGADTAMKEFLVVGGKLYYRTGDPAGAWTLTGPAGKNLSIVTRWNLYLVAVDRDQPWIIWFSNVDPSGPNFLTWPTANYLFVGTTEPITTLLSIFNQLYAGRASGWWGISGVLGVLASVRELAIGNGPLAQRAASVTTDNRIAYWPLQEVPAFWNGGRVQLVPTQRMSPRSQWLNTTPVMARTAPGRGFSANPDRIVMQNGYGHGHEGFDYVDTPTLLREVATAPWTTTVARAADLGVGGFDARHAAAQDNQLIPLPPGWTSIPFPTILNTAPQSWVATDGTNTAWRTTTAVAAARVRADTGFISGGGTVPTGSALALFVNDVEVARTNVTKPTSALSVRTEMAFAINDVLSLRFYNPDPVNTFNLIRSVQAGPNIRRPYLNVSNREAEAAAVQMACPVTGNYDIHVETHGGSAVVGYQILLNRKPITTCTVTYQYGGDDHTPNTLDALNIALTTGDTVGIGVLMNDYNQGWVNRADGPEGTAMPYLRITNRATQEIFGTFAIPGDQVVVTPTERRLMFLGDDGATSKVWSYGGNTGIWTHDEVPVLLGGMAPSDVRGAYQLPEHVVFATQRNYNAESFPKIWTVGHDLDRPALMSDRWSSPYDQSMPAGDVLVGGQVNLASWYDSQGRQVRVRNVEVHFRKWDQGIVGGTNKITARVDSRSAYDRGTTPGIEATWEEPMSGASPSGTEDSWRFNVGEQGFGNGFQVVFTGLYGVALREVVVVVDVRTDRA
jgi:hypothetical protein